MRHRLFAQEGSEAEAADGHLELPFEESVGYQVRLTHRLIQRYLQQKIQRQGVTLGMWYFLRALWEQDGLTQRELSSIVGTMEPTTLSAIKSLERAGFVKRRRNEEDRRKINILLTPQGRALKAELLPLAKEVIETAVRGFSERERQTFLQLLSAIQANLIPKLEGDQFDI